MPNTYAIPFKSFPCTILLLKVYHHEEGFSNWYKIDRVVNNYSIAVTSNDFKNLLILLKIVGNIVFDFRHTYRLNY